MVTIGQRSTLPKQEKDMRSRLLLASVAGAFSLFCVMASNSQTKTTKPPTTSPYLISAKAGGVNFVAGDVSVIRKAGTSGVLLEGDEIAIGDRVSTGDDGKAEILLNPGSYMRIGGGTSFSFASTDLENLKIDLQSGSVVFEVIAADEFKVAVKTPRTDILLTRSGVFRIDILNGGFAKLSTFKGKAYIEPNGKTEVGAGRTASIANGGVSVSKFDKDTNDPLDIWSKERGRELTKLNARLQRDPLRNSLLSSFNQRGWGLYNSFGLWVFDPVRRMWCFLPFGYGWSSPYGWGYDYDLWRCRMPWYVYNQPWNPPSGGGPVGGGTPPTRSINEERRARMHTPPFLRMETSQSASESSVIRRPERSEFPSSSPNFPTSTPTTSSPPIIVAPSAPPSVKTEVTKGKPD